MGLDSFWVHPDGDEVEHPEFDPPLRLIGGLFSGNGCESFRGKVYDWAIYKITGETLYQERIPAERVYLMAWALEQAPYEFTDKELHRLLGRDRHTGLTWQRELDDLIRMFRAYADAGFELWGWW